MKAILLNIVAAISMTSCIHQTLIKPSALAGNTIAIQPLNGYKDSSAETITLAKFLADKYHSKIIVLKPIQIPITYRSFLGIDTAYDADSVLATIYNKLNSSEAIIVGLTKDLLYIKQPIHIKQVPPNFPGPIDTVYDKPVLGLSYIGGNASVISTFRASTTDSCLLNKRIGKIISHEFGHLFGLQHCQDEKCIMSGKKQRHAFFG